MNLFLNRSPCSSLVHLHLYHLHTLQVPSLRINMPHPLMLLPHNFLHIIITRSRDHASVEPKAAVKEKNAIIAIHPRRLAGSAWKGGCRTREGRSYALTKKANTLRCAKSAKKSHKTETTRWHLVKINKQKVSNFSHQGSDAVPKSSLPSKAESCCGNISETAPRIRDDSGRSCPDTDREDTCERQIKKNNTLTKEQEIKHKR